MAQAPPAPIMYAGASSSRPPSCRDRRFRPPVVLLYQRHYCGSLGTTEPETDFPVFLEWVREDKFPLGNLGPTGIPWNRLRRPRVPGYARAKEWARDYPSDLTEAQWQVIVGIADRHQLRDLLGQ